MKKLERSVFANGKRFPVQETATGLKAHLFDIDGWTAVFASNYTQLVRRIKFALGGGQ